MADKGLAQRILNLLSSKNQKPESPLTIATALRVSKKSVNNTLYKLEGDRKVTKLQDTPPMWSIASTNPVSVSESNASTLTRRTRGRQASGQKEANEENVEKILCHLRKMKKPIKAIQIAKAVGLGPKPSDVNPILYRLEKRGIVLKTSEAPVTWKLVDDYQDVDKPPDDQSLEQAYGAASMVKVEQSEDITTHGGNLTIFQDTDLFSNSYNDASVDNKDLACSSNAAPVKMENECFSESNVQDYCCNSNTQEQLEMENSDNNQQTDSSDVKPSSSFRAMFHLDDPVSDSDSDEELDIRETMMEAYKNQNQTQSITTTIDDNMVIECMEEESAGGNAKNDNQDIAGALEQGHTVDKRLNAQDSMDCLEVLSQLASLPGTTNFVLKKKVSLTEDRLAEVMDKCLSLNYVSGSSKFWSITESGRDLVDNKSGTTSKHAEQCLPPPAKKRVFSNGPPPSPMLILKQQSGSTEPNPSFLRSDSEEKSYSRQKTQSSMPQPLMSIHFGSVPVTRTSVSLPSQTSTARFSNSFSHNDQVSNIKGPHSSITFTTQSSLTTKDKMPMKQLSVGGLWDNIQGGGVQTDKVPSVNSSGQKNSNNSVIKRGIIAHIPNYKKPNAEPVRPEITGDLLNYPNQKTSFEVLKGLHKSSKNNTPLDKHKSAFNKGRPLTPMEMLTKGLNKTDISPQKSSELPKTFYQQSMSTSSVTSTSSFTKPGAPCKTQGQGAVLSGNQMNSLPSTSGRSFGVDSGGFKSLPATTTTSVKTSLGNISLALNSESFAALNKNPVSALMEYAQSRKQVARIEVISSRGSSHKPTFELAAFVGSRKFPSIKCHNKKDGRKEASDIAMRQLIAEGQLKASSGDPGVSKPLVSPGSMTHFDMIAALTHRGYTALVSQITTESFAGRKVIAGLVMKRSEADTGVLISLGTGNRCITGEQLSLQGNTINDSHAEIITRRGFIRFLYKQLQDYDPSKHSPMFEPAPSGKLRIKSNISFHLYISTAPCGDGALFSPRDAEAMKAPVDTSIRPPHNPTFSSAVQGLLRTKVEGGEGTIPIEADFVAQTFDGIQRGERLRTMSCTDKICRWNVVGMQGALLSHFLEPVYLDSLTLGLLFDQGHLSRAVCCRVGYGITDIDELLPEGYRLNHPWLGRVTVCDPPREVQKTKALSINWSFGDNGPEVTDGTKGLCYTSIEKGFFSRCSKRNLFMNYKGLCKKYGRQDLLEAANYFQAKLMAKEFNAAKQAMLMKFKENKFGKWVSKPVEEEMFGFDENK